MAGALSEIPGLGGDERVHVFRRDFADMAEFAGMTVDMYAVISDRYVVICDTLLSPTDMQDVVDWASDALQAGRELLVVNSHADWDHCWGNGYFWESAPIIAHRLCRVRMQSEEARRELADFQSRYALFHDVELTPPMLTFTDRLTISGGDLTLELFPAPGHSPDHIAAWLPELRLLLAFDAVEFPLPVIANAESVDAMFATLERFRDLRPRRVLCSHGNSPDLVNRNLAYLREIEARCRTLLHTHQPTDAEIEPDLIGFPFSEVIDGISEPLDTAFYSQAHTNNIRAIMRWLLADRRL